ncbi:hypothetical protein Bca4012_029204 [Brassica carinata]
MGRKRGDQQGNHSVRYGMLNRKPLAQIVMADLSGDSRLGSRLVRLKRLRSWCLVVLMRAGGVKMRQLQLVHIFSTVTTDL